MSVTFTIRLHFLVHSTAVDAVNAALSLSHPNEIELIQSDKHPDLWIASGQWTPGKAGQIQAACNQLPMKVVRGVAFGYNEPNIVIVKEGDANPTPSQSAKARRTVERAIEEWISELIILFDKLI